MFEYENEYFKVLETSSDFQITSKVSGIKVGMGDMVDSYYREYKSLSVGTKAFYVFLKKDLMKHPNIFIEAYFPDDFEILDLQEELNFLRAEFAESEDAFNRSQEIEGRLQQLLSERMPTCQI